MCLECQPPAPCRYPDWGLLLQLRGEDRTSVTELQNLLKQTAEVYRSLVQHAKAASAP